MPKKINSKVRGHLEDHIKSSFSPSRQAKMMDALEEGRLNTTRLHQQIERQEEQMSGSDDQKQGIESTVLDELADIDAQITAVHKTFENDLLVLQKRRRVVEQCLLTD